MSFQADYFDGLSARARPVLVNVVGDSLSFEVGAETHTFPHSHLEVQAKLGKAKRLIDLPGGGRLEAADISELEAAMLSKTSAFWHGIHYVENHLGWVLFSLVATVFVGWLFLQYGVPKIAQYVADSTSMSMEKSLGEQVLQGMDSKVGYFTQSRIDKTRQASIVEALGNMCKKIKDCPQYRLEFRESKAIGANAFAIPGGIIIITDDLIKLSQNDTEIVAVLAHEMGHVKKRHAFRQSIQGTLSGLLLAAATGDFSSAASGMPAVLLQMRYTRELEYEADAFSLQALQKACLPPKAFADILLRLSGQHAAKQQGSMHAGAKKTDSKNEPKENDTSDAGNPIGDLLSSHPDTLLRIKPFLVSKQDCHG